ncbi:MAG: hypothetical protein PHQ82_08270 [Bacteroidales bacterium]|nr:hypothetical protein [Bacteroidales bacterium]
MHNIIKEGEIDYEQLKEITGRIESGNATITRLNSQEEQGRSRGGKRAIEATLIAGGIRSSNRENKEKLTAEQEIA